MDKQLILGSSDPQWVIPIAELYSFFSVDPEYCNYNEGKRNIEES